MAPKSAGECCADVKASKTADVSAPERPNPVVSEAHSEKDGADECTCTFAGSRFVKGLELVLSHMAQSSVDADGKTRQKATPFQCAHAPTMNIEDYLRRIRKYFHCSDECFVLALIYIDRVAKIDPGMAVSALNVHRLLLIAVVLAAKSQDDTFYSNAYYAKVGGLGLKEANSLERHFVEMIAWELYVGPEEYQFYHNAVCAASKDRARSQEWVEKQGQPHYERELSACGQCGHVKPTCVCQSLSISL